MGTIFMTKEKVQVKILYECLPAAEAVHVPFLELALGQFLPGLWSQTDLSLQGPQRRDQSCFVGSKSQNHLVLENNTNLINENDNLLIN